MRYYIILITSQSLLPHHSWCCSDIPKESPHAGCICLCCDCTAPRRQLRSASWDIYRILGWCVCHKLCLSITKNQAEMSQAPTVSQCLVATGVRNSPHPPRIMKLQVLWVFLHLYCKFLLRTLWALPSQLLCLSDIELGMTGDVFDSVPSSVWFRVTAPMGNRGLPMGPNSVSDLFT